MSGFRAILGNRDLLRLVVLRSCALGAFQVTVTALAWQVYLLTGDPFDLGLIGLVQFLPVLLLAPLAGALADRMDRRRLSSLASLIGAISTAALLSMTLAGSAGFPVVALAAMAIATGRAFAFPAQAAMIPMVVRREELSGAIAFGSSMNKMAMIVGPALGGLLLTLGAAVNYGVAVAMLLTSSALALSIRTNATAPGASRRANSGHVGLREMLGGLPFIWNRPLLLGVMSLDLFSTLLGGATALLPYYVRDVLHSGPATLGILRASPAIGAILVAALLVRYPVNRHAGKAMLGGTVGYGLATVVFGLSHHLWLSVAALMIVGMCDFVSVIVRQTVVQLATPDAMRGRVSAVAVTFINASNTLGQFESGVAAGLLGPVGAVVSGGVGSVAVALVWWKLFPDVSRVDLDQPQLAENAKATDRKTIV
jgi:MFS family permease